MGPDLPYIDFTVQQHGPRDHGSQLWWHVGMGEKIIANRNREQKNDKECIIYYNLIYYIYIACLTHLRRVVTRQVLQGVGIFMDLVTVFKEIDWSRLYQASKCESLHQKLPWIGRGGPPFNFTAFYWTQDSQDVIKSHVNSQDSKQFYFCKSLLRWTSTASGSWLCGRASSQVHLALGLVIYFEIMV